MIIRVNRANTERIKMNEKLKLGFGFAEYTFLQDDPKKITCYHCKQVGHRAYRRQATISDGVETYNRILICPNQSNDN